MTKNGRKRIKIIDGKKVLPIETMTIDYALILCAFQYLIGLFLGTFMKITIITLFKNSSMLILINSIVFLIIPSFTAIGFIFKESTISKKDLKKFSVITIIIFIINSIIFYKFNVFDNIILFVLSFFSPVYSLYRAYKDAV